MKLFSRFYIIFLFSIFLLPTNSFCMEDDGACSVADAVRAATETDATHAPHAVELTEEEVLANFDTLRSHPEECVKLLRLFYYRERILETYVAEKLAAQSMDDTTDFDKRLNTLLGKEDRSFHSLGSEASKALNLLEDYLAIHKSFAFREFYPLFFSRKQLAQQYKDLVDSSLTTMRRIAITKKLIESKKTDPHDSEFATLPQKALELLSAFSEETKGFVTITEQEKQFLKDVTFLDSDNLCIGMHKKNLRAFRCLHSRVNDILSALPPAFSSTSTSSFFSLFKNLESHLTTIIDELTNLRDLFESIESMNRLLRNEIPDYYAQAHLFKTLYKTVYEKLWTTTPPRLRILEESWSCTIKCAETRTLDVSLLPSTIFLFETTDQPLINFLSTLLKDKIDICREHAKRKKFSDSHETTTAYTLPEPVMLSHLKLMEHPRELCNYSENLLHIFYLFLWSDYLPPESTFTVPDYPFLICYPLLRVLQYHHLQLLQKTKDFAHEKSRLRPTTDLPKKKASSRKKHRASKKGRQRSGQKDVEKSDAETKSQESAEEDDASPADETPEAKEEESPSAASSEMLPPRKIIRPTCIRQVSTGDNFFSKASTIDYKPKHHITITQSWGPETQDGMTLILYLDKTYEPDLSPFTFTARKKIDKFHRCTDIARKYLHDGYCITAETIGSTAGIHRYFHCPFTIKPHHFAIVIEAALAPKYYFRNYTDVASVDYLRAHPNQSEFVHSGAIVFIFDERTHECFHQCFHETEESYQFNMQLKWQYYGCDDAADEDEDTAAAAASV